MAIPVDEDDKTPLREEIPDLVLGVLICDATNKDLACIVVLIVFQPLFSIVALWCGKTHVQRTLTAWKVLWLCNCTICICGKLVSGESIWRLAVLCWHNYDLDNMSILGEMVANL